MQGSEDPHRAEGSPRKRARSDPVCCLETSLGAFEFNNQRHEQTSPPQAFVRSPRISV